MKITTRFFLYLCLERPSISSWGSMRSHLLYILVRLECIRRGMPYKIMCHITNDALYYS